MVRRSYEGAGEQRQKAIIQYELIFKGENSPRSTDRQLGAFIFTEAAPFHGGFSKPDTVGLLLEKKKTRQPAPISTLILVSPIVSQVLINGTSYILKSTQHKTHRYAPTHTPLSEE